MSYIIYESSAMYEEQNDYGYNGLSINLSARKSRGSTVFKKQKTTKTELK